MKNLAGGLIETKTKHRPQRTNTMSKPVATIETIWQYIDHKKSVDVYRNLQTGLWSVRQGGIVRCHIDQVWLSRVTYHVSEAGRQRVIRDRRKNVHAFMRGRVLTAGAVSNLANEIGRSCGVPERDIAYNPYKCDQFMCYSDEAQCRPILESGFAFLCASRGPRVAAYGVVTQGAEPTT